MGSDAVSQPAERRRLDRVADPAFAADLEERSLADLRSMRDDCRTEESLLSYRRRVLQGQLDIARLEVRRREDGTSTEALLSALPSVLADDPPPEPRAARSVPLHLPEEQPRRRQEDPDAAALARLLDLSDDELAGLIERLEEAERRVSGQRRALLDNLDALQEELVRRYRAGDGPPPG